MISLAPTSLTSSPTSFLRSYSYLTVLEHTTFIPNPGPLHYLKCFTAASLLLTSTRSLVKSLLLTEDVHDYMSKRVSLITLSSPTPFTFFCTLNSSSLSFAFLSLKQKYKLFEIRDIILLTDAFPKP